MKTPKAKIAAALAAMFLFGGVTGAGLTVCLHPYFFPPPQPEEIQKHMLAFLTRRLKLTAEQQREIEPVTADFGRSLQVLNNGLKTQFSELAASTDERISRYLTAGQKAELAKLAREREENFARHGPPPPP